MESAEMIVVRIDGGLGNQMFQYAFGLQLAQKHQSELVLDLAAYEHRPAHGFLLDQFQVEYRALGASEQPLLPRRYQKQRAPLWQSWFGGQSLKRLKEKPFGFAERYLRASQDLYLVGYWQSEQFFREVADRVRQHFRLKRPLSPDSQAALERLQSKPSMALHIRRGDYVTNSQAASIYRNLSLEYYRRAVLARLTERTGVEVTVFSNDIAWCQQQLRLPCPTHFITSSGGPHEEMVVMSAAEAIAIANSTFSWWAAWLSKRQEPRVFAPRKWFHPGTLNDRYLACPGWTLLDDPQVQSFAA